MEFEGVVYKIMPVTRGTSARGEWQRQDVVFDYNDGGQFSRKICVTFFNKESDVAKLREGETFLVSVNIESREYNGRWYTDIRPPSVSCTVAAVRSPSWYEGSGYFSVVLPSIPNVETITIFSSMLFGFETVMPYSPTGDSSSVRK